MSPVKVCIHFFVTCCYYYFVAMLLNSREAAKKTLLSVILNPLFLGLEINLTKIIL